MVQQIIAMGGGGFSMEPENPLLDRFVVEQSGKARPAVCFLPTASGDADSYTVNFYAAFTRLGCRPTHLSLFRLPTAEMDRFLLEQDIIYVGGGNTRSMLALWREWGLDRILRRAWGQGVILAGLSAGAMCWFEEGLTDSVPGEWGSLRGLGFLPGSCCPHYDSEGERRPAYQRLIAKGTMQPGYGLDDGAALHFVGQELRSVVSSRPGARAYRVEAAAGAVEEHPLESTYLGKEEAR